MRRFDYSFLNNGLLPANLVNLTSNIVALKTMAGVRMEEYTQVITELEAVAKVQSIKSSNAIEGIISTDKRIRDIVNKSTAPQGHNELEIAGYRDALDLIHGSYSEIPFSEKSILELHRILLQPSGDDLAGRYKTEDNFIKETDREGVRSVRFTPIPAGETAAAMEQLILAYNAAYSDAEIYPLMLIPCVILDLLCIHPFRDGNGRMSRLLSLLLMYKSGFNAGKYVSIEEQINTYKNYYYTSLQKSSERWHENDNNYFPFIENFLFNLKMSYFELDSRFANFKDKKITKKQRIEELVTGSLLPVSKREICEKLPDISVTTVEVELARLIKSGEIEKIGNGRGTVYRSCR